MSLNHISVSIDRVLAQLDVQPEPRFKEPKEATTFQFSQTGVEELSGTVEVPTPEQQERLRQWLK